MANININKKTITGNNISITNGGVFVDGKKIDTEEKEINITVEGSVGKIEADACSRITVNGNSGSVKTMSGDVEVTGSVNGSISTMSGYIQCGDVDGNVSSMSGDVSTKRRPI